MQADSRSFTERRDDETQGAVLRFVLEEHPTIVAVGDLKSELLANDASFGDVDALQRAIRDLTAVGLLRREGDSLLPTRAALCFERLESL